ncbi:Cytidine deaminase homotetrameric [Trinorchestia longiramus]|nr:Cytidine deaminase homotetrameric [Trinorchestia longiramus]
MSKQVTDPRPPFADIAETNKKLTEEEVERLVGAAKEAQRRAYNPYSKFAVGAALLTEDGSVVQGANVENISYGLTICAERAALCAAIVQGHRNFSAVAVITDVDPESYGTPCGACRQVLAEFGTDMEVYLAQPSGSYIKTTVKKLLPAGFTPDCVQL